MSTPDAGWYPDETEPYLMRWFDGEAWTEETAPLPAAAPEPEPAPVPSSMPALVASGLPALVPVPAGDAVWYPDGAAPAEPEPPQPTSEPSAVPTGRRAARLAAAAQEAPSVVVARAVDTGSADVDAQPPAEVAPSLAATGAETAQAPAALLIPTLEPWEEAPTLPVGLVAARPTPEPEPDITPAVPWAAPAPAPTAWAAPAPDRAPAALAPVSAHPYAPPTQGARAPEGGWAGSQSFPGGIPGSEQAARPGQDPHDALHWIVPLGRSWQSIVAGYLGLLGLVLWPLAPVAVGLGVWAMVKARSGGHGRGRAVFAIVTGLAGTAFGVLFLLAQSGVL